MNWTLLLKKGNVPEPPGYQETLETIQAKPYVKPVKKQKKR